MVTKKKKSKLIFVKTCVRVCVCVCVLPLQYQVDMGASLAYDTGIWGEPTGFFAAKFISWLVFLDCAKGDVRHWKCGRQTLWLI